MGDGEMCLEDEEGLGGDVKVIEIGEVIRRNGKGVLGDGGVMSNEVRLGQVEKCAGSGRNGVERGNVGGISYTGIG